MRVMVIAAHPDDETLGAGGTIARHVDRGDEVAVCVVSEGVTSRHDHIDLQKECASKACAVLGVQDLRFLDLPDQRLDEFALLDMIRPIEAYLRELGPEVVYTHFAQDVNQDHRAVFAAVLVATRPVNGCMVRRLLCYETPSSTEWAAPFPGSVFAPNVYIDITGTLSRKLDAMAAYAETHVSEVRPYPHPRSSTALEVYAQRRGIEAGVGAAEAFMLVRELS
jgi:LmbE family N-acetylglucosaminyl deacetylase